MRTTRRTFLGGAAIASLPLTTAFPQSDSISVDDFLSKATASERAWYHINAVAEALNEMHPGRYVTRIDHETRMAMVYDLNLSKAVRV